MAAFEYRQAGGKSVFVFVRMYLILFASLFFAGTISCLIIGFILGGIFTDGSDGIEGEYAVVGILGAGYGALVNAGIIALFWFQSRIHHTFNVLPAAVTSFVATIVGLTVAILFVHIGHYAFYTANSFIFNRILLSSIAGAIVVCVITKYLNSKKGGCDVYNN